VREDTWHLKKEALPVAVFPSGCDLSLRLLLLKAVWSCWTVMPRPLEKDSRCTAAVFAINMAWFMHG